MDTPAPHAPDEFTGVYKYILDRASDTPRATRVFLNRMPPSAGHGLRVTYVENPELNRGVTSRRDEKGYEYGHCDQFWAETSLFNTPEEVLNKFRKNQVERTQELIKDFIGMKTALSNRLNTLQSLSEGDTLTSEELEQARIISELLGE